MVKNRFLWSRMNEKTLISTHEKQTECVPNFWKNSFRVKTIIFIPWEVRQCGVQKLTWKIQETLLFKNKVRHQMALWRHSVAVPRRLWQISPKRMKMVQRHSAHSHAILRIHFNTLTNFILGFVAYHQYTASTSSVFIQRTAWPSQSCFDNQWWEYTEED
jgi:hypothetical protein